VTTQNPSVSRRRPPRDSASLRRLRFFQLAFFLAFVILIGRLFMLQVVNHSFYAHRAASQQVRDVSTPALRAGIFDRNGSILAVSRPTAMVIADNFQISDPAQEAKQLTSWVHVPVPQLTAMLRRHSGYVILNDHVDLSRGRLLSKLYLPGITVENTSQRVYPNGTLAQSLIGGMNNNGGSAGLEYQYHNLLAGQAGVTRAFVTPSGINLPGSHVQVIHKATPGVGLELTIDAALQYITERNLAIQIHKTGAIAGSALVMDVKTGEILANASLVNTQRPAGVLGPIPAWGNDVAVKGVQQTINNLSFSQAYEPGSVFKLVTFSAALNQGSISPTTPFTVPNAVRVGGRYFHDAERHGTLHLTATQILAQSSNIGTYLVGKTVGSTGLLAQVERLGFGQTTALHYPGETAGLLVNASTYHPSDDVALPIGQVDAVPPIQVLDAYNAIANGGVFVQPKIVRGLVYPNGSVHATPPSFQRVALSPSVALTLNKMLQQVVLAGTGTNAIIPGYSVAGKTGTATIPRPGHDSLLVGSYNASFVGFAPANAPVFSMIVVVERPTTTIFGGEVAAPVFQQVMSYALHRWGIPSNGTFIKPPAGSKASIASDVT